MDSTGFGKNERVCEKVREIDEGRRREKEGEGGRGREREGQREGERGREREIEVDMRRETERLKGEILFMVVCKMRYQLLVQHLS